MASPAHGGAGSATEHPLTGPEFAKSVNLARNWPWSRYPAVFSKFWPALRIKILCGGHCRYGGSGGAEHRGRLDRVEFAIETTLVRPVMKSINVSAAALALTAAVSLSPALAQAPKAFAGERSQPLTTPSSAAVKSAGHFEYRYGYDRHARWRGHWIFVR